MVSFIFQGAKDPDEVLDFGWDFTLYLDEGESIATHAVAVTGATKDSDDVSGNIVTAWLSGGTHGANAEVTYTITTDSTPARTIERTALIRIRHR